MKQWKISLFFLELLLVINMSAVLAATADKADADNFDIKLDTDVNDIYPMQTAKFYITIHNYQAMKDEFKLNFGSISGWSFTTEPVYYLTGISVGGNESVKFPVYVMAYGATLPYGFHSFPVFVKSTNTGESKQHSMQILLRNPAPSAKEYLPSVNLVVDVPGKIDPREPVELKVDVWNKNPLDIKELKISIRSQLYNTDRLVHLGPLSKLTEVFNIVFEPTQAPLLDVLTVKISVGDIEFTPLKKTVEILAYKDLKEELFVEKGLLKKKTHYTFTNNGNSPATKVFDVKRHLLGYLYTFFSSDAEKAEDSKGNAVYRWAFTLKTAESKEIIVTNNYRYICYGIILVALGIFGYYFFRSPLIIRKEARVLKIEDEGISHLKVLLHLKNRTNKAVDNIRVIDRAPHIAKLDKEFALGTMQPEKIIRHEQKGTILKWQIPTLEAFEERIITYKVYSKLKIIGGLLLPRAVLKFKSKNDKFHRVLSNRVTAG